MRTDATSTLRGEVFDNSKNNASKDAKLRLPGACDWQRVDIYPHSEGSADDTLLRALLLELEETNLHNFDSIVLAGDGEPMLVPQRVLRLIKEIRKQATEPVEIRLMTSGRVPPSVLGLILPCINQISLLVSRESDFQALASVCDEIRRHDGCALEITAVQKSPKRDNRLDEDVQRQLGHKIDRWRPYFA